MEERGRTKEKNLKRVLRKWVRLEHAGGVSPSRITEHVGPLKLKLRGTVLVIGLERRQSGEKEDEVCLHATVWVSPFVLQRILISVTLL